MQFLTHKNCVEKNTCQRHSIFSAKNQSGFTLIETLVAIMLLLTSVVALMVLVSKILIVTRGQRLEVTAQYILQEGVEYLRNNRDSALNSGASWTDFSRMGPGCPLVIGVNTPSLCECIRPVGVTNACSIDPLFDEVRICPGGMCPPLLKVDNLGRTMFCTPGANCPGSFRNLGATTFVRSVRLSPNPMNSEELFADVSVSWVDTGGVKREKIINTSLLNW